MYDLIFQVSGHQDKILKTEKIPKNTLNLAGFTTGFRKKKMTKTEVNGL